MLQLFNYIRCMRLPYQITPQIFSGNLRYMSDKSKKPPCKTTQPTSPSCKDKSKADAKKEECKKKKEPAAKTECKKKEKPEVKKTECKSKQPEEAKKTECKKPEPKAEKKSESAIAGGTKCNVENIKDPCPPASEKKKGKQKSCEELILEREGLNKPKKGCQNLAKVSGGGPKCPCKPCRPKPNYEESKKWGRITLMGVLPVVAILTILVFTTHKEGERPPFKPYPHMYNRTKPFYFGDGNHSRFHNSHWNALPPDGYEDEIDTEAVGKKPETDSEREERLKEFDGVLKDWKKLNDKREAEAKKAEANAEKEAKKQQELEEKEEKKRQAEETKRQAEAEKEEKKRQAEAEKEAKKLQAQAEKEEKKLRVEFEKLRKQEEAEEKKREKEAQNLGSSFFFRTATED